MTGFHSTVSPWAKVTVFSCRAMPMNEQTMVAPGVNARLYAPLMSVAAVAFRWSGTRQ